MINNSVRLISTSTVRPASDHHNGFISRIELTPWDPQSLFFGPIQKGILLHKLTDDSYSSSLTNGNLIQHFKLSFSRTLDVFYPLAGHLSIVENDDNTTSFIDCNDTGALFVHAAIGGVTVADILKSIIVPADDIVYSFFLMNGVSNNESADSKLPLLAVQVTELVHGIFITRRGRHVFLEFLQCLVQNLSRAFGREFLHNIVVLPARMPLGRDEIRGRPNMPP